MEYYNGYAEGLKFALMCIEHLQYFPDSYNEVKTLLEKGISGAVAQIDSRLAVMESVERK